jgi:hypothetical protein
MRGRWALAAVLVSVLLGSGPTAAADPIADFLAPAAGLSFAPPPLAIVAVDLNAIPHGTLPPPLTEAEASARVASQTSARDLKLEKTQQRFAQLKKTALRVRHTRLNVDAVEISPSEPEIAALYIPWQGAADFQGESAAFSCYKGAPLSPLRWETLTVSPDGAARLDVKDLWLDGEHCLAIPVSQTEVAFKAIAWVGAEPWLFAARDENTVTFLLPSTDSLSVDALVGTPFTVRGSFTRVTLPLGRWGSGSIVATLPSLELKAAAVTATKKQSGPRPEPVPLPPAVEVAVELVQTMAERTPTLTVRRSLAVIADAAGE